MLNRAVELKSPEHETKVKLAQKGIVPVDTILVGPCTEKTSVMKFKTNGKYEALALSQSPTQQACEL